MIEFTSLEQMLLDTARSGLPLWERILESDCRRQDITREQSFAKMTALLDAMEQADRSYRSTDRSASGLSGGDGEKMEHYASQGTPLCGPFLSEVMAGALRMGECNACMKRIVAAPTAGACGVLPAVLLPYARQFGASKEQLVQSLYVASGFGMVIAMRLYLIIIPIIISSDLVFFAGSGLGNAILNHTAQMLMVLGGAWAVLQAGGVITGILAGNPGMAAIQQEGRIGGMVFGGAVHERISLNEDTLWSGGPSH